MRSRLFTTILLIFTLSVSLSAAIVDRGTCGADGDNLTWSLDDEGLLKIEGTGAMTNYTVSKSASWKKYSSAIKAISLPDGLTNVGDYAFPTISTITSITIPGSVVEIGEAAFEYCSNLTRVTLSEGLKTIGNSAFYQCYSLTSINIPEGVTTIGQYAFVRCYSLAHIEIPSSVANIGEHAFSLCYAIAANVHNYCRHNLTSYGLVLCDVEQPDGVCIKDNVVVNCRTAATSVTIPEGVTCIGYQAFFQCRSISNIVVPNGVEIIKNEAFHGCRSLESVSLPTTVTNIESEAFHYCIKLTSITLPRNVTSLGANTFTDCKALTEVVVMMPTPPESYATTFDNTVKENGRLVVPAASLETYKTAPFWSDFKNIESSSTIIQSGTCGAEGDNLTWTLTVDGHLSIEGTGEMEAWTSYKDVPWSSLASDITSVSLPEGLTNISRAAFEGCTILLSITIPNTVTSIGEYAFLAAGLTSITLPNTITSIDDSAFDYCDNISTVNINILDFALDNNLAHSSVSNDVEYNYFWEGEPVTYIPAGTTTIGDYALYKYKKLSQITIPPSLKTVSPSAFRYCTNLTTLIYAEGCTKVINTYCKSVENVTIPSSATSIEASAFKNTTQLKQITVNVATPLAIDASVFEGVNKSQCKLMVPAASVEDYKRAAIWQEFDIVAVGQADDEGEDDPTSLDTDVSSYTDIAYIEAQQVKPGTDITVPILLRNTLPTTGLTFTMVLPEGFSIITDNDGYPEVMANAARFDNITHSNCYADFDTDGNITFNCTTTNPTRYKLTGNDGAVATIRLHVDATLAEGYYPIMLRDITIANTESTTIQSVRTTIHCVSRYLLGDANIDGQITLQDVTTMQPMILDLSEGNVLADVTQNGQITIGDLVRLNYMLIDNNTPYALFFLAENITYMDDFTGVQRISADVTTKPSDSPWTYTFQPNYGSNVTSTETSYRTWAIHPNIYDYRFTGIAPNDVVCLLTKSDKVYYCDPQTGQLRNILDVKRENGEKILVDKFIYQGYHYNRYVFSIQNGQCISLPRPTSSPIMIELPTSTQE